MTPAELERAASILFGFGFRWQSALSRALDTDQRLVRRWVAGERPVSDRAPGQIAKIARARARELERLAEELDGR